MEAALARPPVRLIAEVPFAEDAGCVPGFLQHLCDGGCLWRQPLALKDGMRDAILELMPSGQEGRASWGASRADVEIREAHAFVMKPVEVGRLEDRVAVAGQIAVALVIRQHKDDIRPAPIQLSQRPGPIVFGLSNNGTNKTTVRPRSVLIGSLA